MTEQMNVPKLRFDEFDGEWQKLTLKQVSTKNISYGVVQTGDKDLIVPCVRVVDLTSGSLNRDTFIKTSEAINQSYKKTILESGELMVALRGVIGLTRAVPVDLVGCNLTRGIARISPDQKRFSSQFIEQALNTPKSSQRFDQLKNGSALKEISIGELNKYSTDYPYLPEQQKIASFLSKVDEKITLLTEKKDKLAEYKKGVMQQLFNGKWEKQDGQLTFIPPTLRFKADDGSDFPDWEEVSLGDVLIPTFREVDKPSNNYLAIGVRSHCKGTFQKPDSEPDKVAMDKLYVVRAGDLIVNITFAWEGAIAIVKDEDDGGYVSHRFPTYLFNEDRLLGSFFESLFKQKRFRFDLDLISPGGAGRNRVLSKKEFLKLTVSVPSINEQKKISEGLTLLQQKLDLANSELEKAKEWKKGLLQQMFV
ncbi:TPA: restriction endonuclease subunit S [Vibrio parahaemolyticus]|uniref:restriction endonuclease subunit S n=1 Tax=Vibrio parahaemolyticus TaxID=670 RepID=UPI001124C3BA|nr:restriction endonuclease subunit S [Vibrio parahaemolyticus]HDU8574247.1 restriction endonuclease subunit S [Vibrio parahaemolyticus]